MEDRSMLFIARFVGTELPRLQDQVGLLVQYGTHSMNQDGSELDKSSRGFYSA